MFSIFLFGNAGWSLEKGSPVTVDELLELREEVTTHIDQAIQAVNVLTKAGFENQMHLCDIEFFREDIEDSEAAKAELSRLGLNVEMFDFLDDYEEDDEEVQFSINECPECGCVEIVDDEINEDDEDQEESNGFNFGVR